MYILGIDTSTSMGSVGLISEDALMGEYTLSVERTRSEKVMSTTALVLEDAGISPKELSGISVTLGPGSFTGLRIGIVTAKALAYALDKPLVGVSTLEALAENFRYTDKLICPLLDARRGQVYTGLYKFEDKNARASVILEDVALGLEDLLAKVEEYADNVIFCGQGAQRFKEPIARRIGDRAIIPSGFSSAVRGSQVAHIGLGVIRRSEVTDDAFTIKPSYLRRSDAEIRAGR
jgi:tRNA threonylcarbamoyladenosine biosynthesis protein TsaB